MAALTYKYYFFIHFRPITLRPTLSDSLPLSVYPLVVSQLFSFKFLLYTISSTIYYSLKYFF